MLLDKLGRTELRCRWCQKLIIKLCGPDWWYRCPNCWGEESSTGLKLLPSNQKELAYLRKVGKTSA